MRGGPTFDAERVSMNVARLKKGGENFEIVIDPDKAVEFKEGKDVDIADILKAEKIFFDARKGELASEEHMQTVFGTTYYASVAEQIIEDGEIQLTAQHREQVRERKRNKLVNIIHMNAINPTTGTVHPVERIDRALEEAKVRLDEFRTAEDQVQEVVKKLQPIIPIKFTTFTAEIHLPANHAAGLYGTLQQYGSLKAEQWLNDGSLAVKLEVPAGRYNDLVDELSSKTHGAVDISKHEN